MRVRDGRVHSMHQIRYQTMKCGGIGNLKMNKKLKGIREQAIKVREKLSYNKADEQRYIGQLDKIIRGTVLVKWMHLIAGIFFVVFTAIFTCLVYPKAQIMMIMLGFGVVGYGVTLLGVIIQIKLYERTIGKLTVLVASQ